MQASDFKAALVARYGERGWQVAAAEELGVDVATIRRWCSGSSKITGPAVAAVKCWKGIQDAGTSSA